MSAPYQAVVIGVSAGAVEALSVLLPSLPHNYPLPIFIVVHLPPDRPSAMVDLFAAKCGMHVKEAEDKETIRPGTIYFAPPDYHLLVERTCRFPAMSRCSIPARRSTYCSKARRMRIAKRLSASC